MKQEKKMRGKKVTVIGFGSDIAIGAEGEAFCGGDQKLLPHLICVRGERGFRVLQVTSFKIQMRRSKINYIQLINVL